MWSMDTSLETGHMFMKMHIQHGIVLGKVAIPSHGERRAAASHVEPRAAAWLPRAGLPRAGEVRSWGLALNKGGFLFFFFLIFLKGKQKPHELNKGDNFKIQTAQTRKESRAEGDTTARPGCGPRPTQKQRASPHFTKTEQSTLLSWHAEVPYLRKLSQTSLC